MGTGGGGRTVWCQASGPISALVSIRAAMRGGEESNQVSDPFTRRSRRHWSRCVDGPIGDRAVQGSSLGSA